MPVYSSMRCNGCGTELLYAVNSKKTGSPKAHKVEVKKMFPLYFEQSFQGREMTCNIPCPEPRRLCRKCLKHLVKVGKVIEKVLFRSALTGKPRLTKALAMCLFRHFESESGSVDKVYVSPKRYQDLRSRFFGWTGNEFDPERRYATIKATKCFGYLWGAGVFPQKAVSPRKIVLLNKRVALTYSLITGKCLGPFAPRGDEDGSDTRKKE